MIQGFSGDTIAKPARGVTGAAVGATGGSSVGAALSWISRGGGAAPLDPIPTEISMAPASSRLVMVSFSFDTSRPSGAPDGVGGALVDRCPHLAL